jgi:hypothetical protein
MTRLQTRSLIFAKRPGGPHGRQGFLEVSPEAPLRRTRLAIRYRIVSLVRRGGQPRGQHDAELRQVFRNQMVEPRMSAFRSLL